MQPRTHKLASHQVRTPAYLLALCQSSASYLSIPLPFFTIARAHRAWSPWILEKLKYKSSLLVYFQVGQAIIAGFPSSSRSCPLPRKWNTSREPPPHSSMKVVNILLSSVVFTSTRPNYRVVALPVASPFLHKYLSFLRLTLFLWII